MFTLVYMFLQGLVVVTAVQQDVTARVVQQQIFVHRVITVLKEQVMISNHALWVHLVKDQDW